MANPHKTRNRESYIFNTGGELYVSKEHIKWSARTTAKQLANGDKEKEARLYNQFMGL